ncbi:hypothetical protein Tco_1157631 [Tanacetum coccineum]
MAESSSQNPTSPNLTPKEEPVTLDKPDSPNPFLPADQVEFTFDEIAFTTNNEVALLYPSHPNQDYLKDMSDFISKCCLKEAFTRSSTQYKEYLSEFCRNANKGGSSRAPTGSKTGHSQKIKSPAWPWTQTQASLQFLPLYPGISAPKDSISQQQGMDEGTKNYSFDHTLAGENKEFRADDISRKVKLEDLSDILKDTRSDFFTPDSLPYEPIIVLDESEEEEDAAKDKDTEDTLSQKEELEQAKAKAEAEVVSMKAKPSYPDINQLTKLLVAELKNIQWKPPTEFLSLPSQVSSVQEKLKTLDSLPSLLHKVTDTLNWFSTMVDTASGATSMNVPSAGQATASPAEGEKNTTDAGTNLKDELIDLLGKDVVTQYYTKKLL